MDVTTHHTIADLYRSLNMPVEQDIDFTIHFKPHLHPEVPFRSPVFRSDYFYFGFIKDGAGSYCLDDSTFTFGPQTIYFTNPGHLKSYGVDALNDAWMISLTESFMRENVHPDIFNEFPFLLAEVIPPKVLTKEKFAEFETLYQQIAVAYTQESVYKNRIIGSLFEVLLLKFKEACWLGYDPIAEGSRNSRIVRSFKELLEARFAGDVSARLQVQDFADELNLHPNYLNTVIRAKTGKTINEWIAGRTLSQARSLLRNTSMSVKEIAYSLGYSEPTHFNRFFKSHQHITPIAYRKEQHSLK